VCFDGYITIDSSTPSKSGLYVLDLPGMNLAALSGIKKTEQASTAALFSNLYRNAQVNLKIDVQKKLAGRFHIDKKLITRETSEFKTDVNVGAELAGVKISVSLPKYARLHILSIGVNSDEAYQDSPGVDFFIYKENADGDLLSTITSELTEGKNTIQVYQEFEEEELFIAYDPSEISLKETKNKYYSDNTIIKGYHKDMACMFPCSGGDFGTVHQINGGGLNVKFLLYCSMEKLICENLPLFQYALWYRIGVEILKEKLVSDRVNRFTVLTPEDAVRLMGVVNEDYNAALDSAVMNIKMTEDPTCFICKSTITSKTNLP
jgi:hypothetical protein